jgi:hypothetical protein
LPVRQEFQRAEFFDQFFQHAAMLKSKSQRPKTKVVAVRMLKSLNGRLQIK